MDDLDLVAGKGLVWLPGGAGEVVAGTGQRGRASRNEGIGSPFPMYQVHLLLAGFTILVGQELLDWELVVGSLLAVVG